MTKKIKQYTECPPRTFMMIIMVMFVEAILLPGRNYSFDGGQFTFSKLSWS